MDTLAKQTSKHKIQHKPKHIFPDTIVEDEHSLNVKIARFKHLVADYALAFMADESKYAEPREVKNVVQMIVAIDPKLQNEKPTNVLVQSLVQKFADDV